MSSFTNLFIICVLLVLMVIFAVSCKTFLSNPKLHENRKLASSLELNQNWLELKLESPVEATHERHIIGLKINNIKKWADDKHTKLLLDDGTQAFIEIELIDENGTSTSLYPNGFAEYVEFGKRTKDFTDTESEKFKVGTKFIKIRLRSDKNISVEEIIWAEFIF